MILAFMLVAIVDGNVVSDEDMLFRSIYRCNQFAHALETGALSPRHSSYWVWRHKNIKSYCVPKLVEEDSTFYD